MLGQLIAVTFIVLVVLTIRKARARGQRLFVDEPTARVKALRNYSGNDHYWDA